MAGGYGYGSYRELSYEQISRMNSREVLWIDIRENNNNYTDYRYSSNNTKYGSNFFDGKRVIYIPYNGYDSRSWIKKALWEIEYEEKTAKVNIVIVCCRHGKESLLLAKMLNSRGINAASLKFGIGD